MAELDVRPQINVTITLRINEGEARFLDAMLSYGAQPLIDAVKEKLGKVYIEGHEKHGIHFCETVRTTLPGILRRLEDARKAFNPNQ